MKEKILAQIAAAQKVMIVQAENPDADSLGSALALEQILGRAGKAVSLYCPVQIPKYLRHFAGWDRVADDFDFAADLAILVDTESEILLSKVLADPARADWLRKNPVVVLDHHQTEGDLSFAAEVLTDLAAVATGEIVFELFAAELDEVSAQALYGAIAGDTLGLTTENVSAATFAMVARLIEAGANAYTYETARRELMKKDADILAYKARLLERIEYHLDGKLATVHVPFEEIEQYSDRYNPTVLVLEEMRMVRGVEVAVGLKSYPDGKLTAKIRSNQPVAEAIAGFFGGGGHHYAAGFRIYEELEATIPELVAATAKALQ